MNIEAPALVGKDSITVHRAEAEYFDDVYVNCLSDEAMSRGEGAGFFSRVAELLREQRIQPIQQKIYGTAALREDVLDYVRTAYRGAGVDVSVAPMYLEYIPAVGGALAGMQIWGVQARDPAVSVSTVDGADGVKGRLLTAPGFRALYLPAIHGCSGGEPNPDREAVRMFDKAISLVKDHGFSFTQVLRTWIYSARLLDWYGELNAIRTRRYREEGLGGGLDGAGFPASTGIQGRWGAAECCMDLLAVAPVDGVSTVRPLLGSRRQPPAFSYGSSFVRGVVLERSGRKTIYISGTASINAAGESTYPGDAQGQCLEMLLSVAALLEEEKANLGNIRSATLYCKTREAFQAYREIVHLLGVSFFPVVPVIADICRPELLVELDAVAVV